jgi:Protein of unknown function (DUF1275)
VNVFLTELVPDLTTTVLTLTITSLVADSTLLGGSGARPGRRLIAIAGMLLGSFLGAVLVNHAASYLPLVVAAGSWHSCRESLSARDSPKTSGRADINPLRGALGVSQSAAPQTNSGYG